VLSELRYRWRLQMQVLTTSSPSRIIKSRSGCCSQPPRRSEDANGNRTMAIYRFGCETADAAHDTDEPGTRCADIWTDRSASSPSPSGRKLLKAVTISAWRNASSRC
jgi:hypothetical protein